MGWFVENYIPKNKKVRILDVGSYNVNGCYRTLFKNHQIEYVGLDVAQGLNVDFVPKDAYNWKELEDESFDFIISGNAFEHIEFPWLTMEQIYKKLKKNGFACILAPFSHVEHRYPVDCYRYYNDGFRALAKWAGFKVVECTVGGMPRDTTDPQWTDKHENYDDTMIVVAKLDSDDAIKGCPRFNYSKMVRKWS